jgi:hypothetical protein
MSGGMLRCTFCWQLRLLLLLLKLLSRAEFCFGVRHCLQIAGYPTSIASMAFSHSGDMLAVASSYISHHQLCKHSSHILLATLLLLAACRLPGTPHQSHPWRSVTTGTCRQSPPATCNDHLHALLTHLSCHAAASCWLQIAGYPTSLAFVAFSHNGEMLAVASSCISHQQLCKHSSHILLATLLLRAACRLLATPHQLHPWLSATTATYWQSRLATLITSCASTLTHPFGYAAASRCLQIAGYPTSIASMAFSYSGDMLAVASSYML